MDWLSIEIANRLQLFTLPLEVAGLALATVEVRFRTLTQWLNGQLMRANVAIEESDARWRERYPRIARWTVYEPMHVPTPAWLHMTMFAIIALALLASITLGALRYFPEFAATYEASRSLLDAFLWWVYIPVVAGTIALTLIVRFIARFAEDRAVGTLGIVLAGFGVAGEAYQFAVAIAL